MVEKIEHSGSFEDSLSLLLPMSFVIFVICLAQLNCYIERRRFDDHRHT